MCPQHAAFGQRQGDGEKDAPFACASVRASCSNFTSTSSNAVRAARTNSGSDMVANASTTARQVNTTS